MTGRYGAGGGQYTPGYFTGLNWSGMGVHSFFVFDLPDQFGPIFSASLRLNTGNVTHDEPISMILLGSGLVGVGAVGRRRRKQQDSPAA